jgi:hypothetical protein
MTGPGVCAAVRDAVGGFEDQAREWHELPPAAGGDGVAALLTALHAANFGLWHCEDRARDPAAPDAEVARWKRTIDRLNARRNRTIEAIDECLLRDVAGGLAAPATECQSETAGMLIDRLSILTLRIHHTAGPDATERLEVLRLQRADLVRDLDRLLGDLAAGCRSYRVYRQFKRAVSGGCGGPVWDETG